MKLVNVFPFLEWLSSYKKSWLKGDITAGLTVGVMLIPQGIAYAMIAGLPPIYGLYTAMIPQVVYAFFGTSRQLAVGPSAMDSLIVASGIGAIATLGSENFILLAILLALFIGVIQLAFGLFRLGFLVNFLSKPVISGFTSAAALIIGLNQLKHLLGVDMQRNNHLQNLVIDAVNHIKYINWATFLIGLFSILILVFLKRYFKKIPAALVVVILGIVVVKLFNLHQYGVKIVGNIPKGLPYFKIPQFSLETIKELGPLAITLALIAFMEAISVAKAIESKHMNYKVKANKELIALGLGNIVGSLFQSYPSTGGFGRTAVNNQSGANTPFAAIISASVVALTLLFLTPLFYYLPKAVLGAIILVAVFSLLDFKVPYQLWKYTKRDLIILNVTLLVTATVGIKEGIITGVILSLVMLIYKSTKPHVAVLGNVPNSYLYRNIKRFDQLIVLKDVLIIRFDAQLHFANTTYFKDTIYNEAYKKGKDLKIIVIDGESLNNLDSSGVYALEEILKYFKEKNIELYFTGLKGPVRDTIYKSNIIQNIGQEHCFMSIQEAIDYYHNKTDTTDNKVYIQQRNS
ncbi:SulP family inorganic anion transporter [Lutibacter sp.]|uniref:SulP family inorganic anion transporter n=1 Tax=Lutibacter sp. TaxID=1925666 RepID=UPI0025BF8A2B|nr:solute carrier family 26 protein [Lutibacter sp.]MCF6181959.1 solute carrier family 26 protein [Lutibacter sp.]